MDGNSVRSVDRAASLLIALGEFQGEAGVTELARRLELHKSTASRLLSTLQKRGLVEQDGDSGKYRLGLVVIRLAERAERTRSMPPDQPKRRLRQGVPADDLETKPFFDLALTLLRWGRPGVAEP